MCAAPGLILTSVEHLAMQLCVFTNLPSCDNNFGPPIRRFSRRRMGITGNYGWPRTFPVHPKDMFRSKLYFGSFLMVSALLAALAGCGGHTYHLNPAMSVPAATGTIQVGHDHNGNTTIDLKVRHLAMPGNLTPPATTYVIWIQRAGLAAENQGQLQVSNNLRGEFKTTVPYKNFQIFITAENNPHATAPSGQEVLRQQISQ
jgi:hypothetical protein